MGPFWYRQIQMGQVEKQLKCMQRVPVNAGARLEELEWKICGNPAKKVFVKTFIRMIDTPMILCEDCKGFFDKSWEFINRSDLLIDAGVPVDVAVRSVSQEWIKDIVERNEKRNTKK